MEGALRHNFLNSINLDLFIELNKIKNTASLKVSKL